MTAAKPLDADLEKRHRRWVLAQRFTLNTRDPMIYLPMLLIGIASFTIAGTALAASVGLWICAGLTAGTLSGVMHLVAKQKIPQIEQMQDTRDKVAAKIAATAAAKAKSAAAATALTATIAALQAQAGQPDPALESAPDLTQDFRNGTAAPIGVRVLRLKPATRNKEYTP